MKLRADVMLRRVADSWLVIPLVSAKDLTGVMELNDSGSFIWQQLESGANEQDVAQALSARYGLSAEEALADTRDFLQILTGQGYALP